MDMFDKLGSLLNEYIDDTDTQNKFFESLKSKSENDDIKVKVFTYHHEKHNEKPKIKVPAELEIDFKRLGVEKDSDLETCKKAYLKLIKKYHPDKHIKNPSDYEKATLITKYVTESYRRISEWYKSNNN